MHMEWYTMDDIDNATSKKQVEAQCLVMWGNCYLENPPSYFGEFMVKAGSILGYPALIKNLKVGRNIREQEQEKQYAKAYK